MNTDISFLIGIPYEKMDCWGLAREFYKQMYGVELKHYFKDMPEDRKGKRDLIYTNKGDFVEVDMPKFGDLIVFAIRGIESHIGIYIDATYFLHSSRGIGSVLEKLERWQTHITGYYGHTPRILKIK